MKRALTILLAVALAAAVGAAAVFGAELGTARSNLARVTAQRDQLDKELNDKDALNQSNGEALSALKTSADSLSA